MTKALQPALTTARLRLLPVTPADLDALCALWTDPEVRRFLFDDVAVDRDRAAALLAECLALASDGLGLWTARPHDAERVLGCIGLIPVGAAAAFDPTLAGAVEPLVALAPAVWRQGLATEALAAIAAYAFDERGLPRLVAVVDAPNAASHRLMHKAGFRMTGESDGPRYRLRSYERMKHV